MDKEQEELQNLGFFGIWKESLKTIFTWRKIFLQLWLTLILPFSFICLTHIEVSYLLVQKISHLENTLANDVLAPYEATSMALSSVLVKFYIVQVVYIVLCLTFFVLLASVIFYTVGCIYSSKRVTFKEVFRVLPKVWMRVMVTSIYIVGTTIVYNFVCYLIVINSFDPPFNPHELSEKKIFLGVLLLILYLLGIRFMGQFCQLANVVSVLEESYGIQALRRSKTLMKGKMGTSSLVFLVSPLCLGGTLYLYARFLVFDPSNIWMFKRVGFGVIASFLINIFILLALVVQPVFYIVCKSYHHHIDKYVLIDHRETYRGA